MKRRPAKKKPLSSPERLSEETELRIIGGKLRRSKLTYSGLKLTRPMKNRVREAVFNLLGDSVKDRSVIDLFAGTGVLGLEAISRGAKDAIFIERHFPTAELIKANANALKLEECTQVYSGDTFHWWRNHPELPSNPWLVFVCPPYEFYMSREEEMLTLITEVIEQSPAGSEIVVETDSRFDCKKLPSGPWDLREYTDTQIAILDQTNVAENK